MKNYGQEICIFDWALQNIEGLNSKDVINVNKKVKYQRR